jgi:outer membrane protein
MKLSLLSFLTSLPLLVATGTALAQDANASAQPPRWGLGIGTVVADSVYAGEGTRVTPFPLISYEGERFFWRGIGGGAHLFRRGGLSVDAILAARVDGVDRDDFGRAELAARGIDRALLEDRDDALDAGVAVHWRGTAGELEFVAKGDVTGTSKGYEASIQYGYPFEAGGTRITPHVGVSHLSKKLANYYFGTLPEEAARGVLRYQPGGATVPRIGIDFVRPFAQRWAVIGSVSYRHLPGKLADSPLVDKDADGSVAAFIGLSRGF